MRLTRRAIGPRNLAIWGSALILLLLLVTSIVLFVSLPGANAFNDRVASIFAENDALTTGEQIKLLEIMAQSGTAFAEVTNAVWGFDLPPLMLPVAVGTAARRAGLEVEPVLLMYLHGFLSNLVAAAQRLAPIGQTGGQRVLAALHPACADVVRATRDADETDIYSTAFLSDVAAMRHETLDTRIFQS